MAKPDEYDYNWTKVYAVQTNVNNEVQAGDKIIVEDRNGGSEQEVLSVTIQNNHRTGKPFKTLLLKSLEKTEAAVRNA